MNILGIEKSSFIDYPNKISTVIFTGGCNFSCPYCHNSHLLNFSGKIIDEEEVLNFLKKRKKFIDAVCITGGEPTLQKDLKVFIKKVKEEGFLVKLDTNGTSHMILKKLIDEGLLDYIAMDIKAPLHKYNVVTQQTLDTKEIKESIDEIKSSGIDYEFRTTVCQELLKPQDILAIVEEIKGSKKYYLQNFRDGENVLGGIKQYTPYSPQQLEEIIESIKPYFQECKVR